MSSSKISSGTIHRLPSDLQARLVKQPESLAAWNDITPLARNEWICWVESAKKLPTRSRRLERTAVELAEGVHRPCCWAGCSHRQKLVDNCF
jgi:uncharacterized protein YdeI (YjbR/CyaY-like superfamily)